MRSSAGGVTAREERGLAAFEVAASALALLGCVVLIGLVVSWVRLAAARLPADFAISTLGLTALFGAGLRAVAAMAVVFSGMCLFAYLASARKWDVNAQDWHDLVTQGGVHAARRRPGVWTDRAERDERRAQASRWQKVRRAFGRPEELARSAPIGDPVVRVVAGFNILVIAGVVGLAAARVAELILPHIWWVTLGVWALVLLAVQWVLTKWGPLWWRPWVHALAWILVTLAAAFVAAPLGILILTGIGLSTAGRVLARHPPPPNPSRFLRSPLPWALLTAYTFVALAYYATPPVSFQRAVVDTPRGEQVGGLLSRTGAGTYLVTCTALANATSTAERVAFIPAGVIRQERVGGPADNLDSGERPSLVALGLSALGVDAHPPTLLRVDLRARRATCAGAPPTALSAGFEDPALGAGVIAGPAPAAGRASDGEPPIQLNGMTPPAVARLARLYQPTLEVTVADRFWPVSVGAVLADVGADGKPTCLVHRGRGKCVAATSLASLSPAGSSSGDYLRFPAAREPDPANQFRAFERGQYVPVGALEDWLADPGRLAPWYSAQIYFFYAGGVDPSRLPGSPAGIASRLIGLQYWFFYPYNYYPTVVGAELMNEAPLAGDIFNTDLHQGDWEHVTVLLDPSTLTPQWLYTARHAGEGRFYGWSSPGISFDQDHPIVQAAFGGHPSYPSGCGAQPRALLRNLSSDWLVCGSGRFALRAATTPLVDLAHVPWSCWKGHFGEAPPNGRSDPNQLDLYYRGARGLVYVDGPPSPLWQAENGDLGKGTGVCRSTDPAAGERTALRSARR